MSLFKNKSMSFVKFRNHKCGAFIYCLARFELWNSKSVVGLQWIGACIYMSNLQKELNQLVASWSVLYMKLHNFHWYVKGSAFFTLHLKFEELYNEASEHLDHIAERILALNGQPIATLKEHLEISEIKEAVGSETAEQMVKTLIQDFETVMSNLKAGMSEAANNHDRMTEDLLNSIYQSLEKHVWMLKAFLG